jgi:hypothetical protein
MKGYKSPVLASAKLPTSTSWGARSSTFLISVALAISVIITATSSIVPPTAAIIVPTIVTSTVISATATVTISRHFVGMDLCLMIVSSEAMGDKSFEFITYVVNFALLRLP